MQFWTLGCSKMEGSEFFDSVMTYNDHPRYIRHVVGRIYVLFTLFAYWVRGGGGGGSNGLGAQPAYARFQLIQLKTQRF